VPIRTPRKDPKAAALLEEGTLNPFPQKVSDPKFQEREFFDPRDVVQVKYEMLRRVSVDNVSVTDATDEYGVSRPTYYQAKAGFNEAGLVGLVPRKRGPRGPHKLQGEILAFVEQQHLPGKPIRARELATLIREQFSVEVHPRTIERALREKKTAQ
jgi:transposase